MNWTETVCLDILPRWMTSMKHRFSFSWVTISDDIPSNQRSHQGLPRSCSPSLSKTSRWWPSVENICTHPFTGSQTNRWPRPSVTTPHGLISFSDWPALPVTLHSMFCVFVSYARIPLSIRLSNVDEKCVVTRNVLFPSVRWHMSRRKCCCVCVWRISGLGGTTVQSRWRTSHGSFMTSTNRSVEGDATHKRAGQCGDTEQLCTTWSNIFASWNTIFLLSLKNEHEVLFNFEMLSKEKRFFSWFEISGAHFIHLVSCRCKT